jgi:magnesium transporter
MTDLTKGKKRMKKRFGMRALKKIGLPPGTIVSAGTENNPVHMSVIDYSETACTEKEIKKPEECFPLKETPSVSWINIDGLQNVGIIEKIGNHFSIHPLVLEDILNVSQRPKSEDFDEYLFIVIKMLSYDDAKRQLRTEQVSLIIGSNYVISFQEREGDVFTAIRERIRTAKGRIRRMGADYLAYCLIDAIVDNYFAVIEKIGEQVEFLEEELLKNAEPAMQHGIHILKRETIFLRKSVWPLREVISRLSREENPLIAESTKLYFRDVYDHTIQVIDTVETLRDMLSGLLDLYLSSLSNRMNEVMKVLTMIATVFIPITFIAGVYGMNFEWMPELAWTGSYPLVWMIFILISGLMLVYFKKKKWL